MRAQSQYRQPPSPFESEESDIEVETVHTPESYIGEVHGRQGLNDVLGDIRDIAGDTRDDRMSVETMTAPQISLSSQDSFAGRQRRGQRTPQRPRRRAQRLPRTYEQEGSNQPTTKYARGGDSTSSLSL